MYQQTVPRDPEVVLIKVVFKVVAITPSEDFSNLVVCGFVFTEALSATIHEFHL